MCPSFERSSSLGRPRRSSSISLSSWVVPFEPLQDQELLAATEENQEAEAEAAAEEEQGDGESSEIGDELAIQVRRLRNTSYFFDRQAYIHTYQFSRSRGNFCDKLRGSVKRLGSAARALLPCSSSSSSSSSSSDSSPEFLAKPRSRVGSKLRRLLRPSKSLVRCLRVPRLTTHKPDW